MWTSETTQLDKTLDMKTPSDSQIRSKVAKLLRPLVGRGKHQLTQEVLAAKMHIGQPAVSKWLNETATITLENLLKIFDVYQLTMDAFIKQTSSRDAIVDALMALDLPEEANTVYLFGKLDRGPRKVLFRWLETQISTLLDEDMADLTQARPKNFRK